MADSRKGDAFAPTSAPISSNPFGDSNGTVRHFYPASTLRIRDLHRRRLMEMHNIDIQLGYPVFRLVDAHVR